MTARTLINVGSKMISPGDKFGGDVKDMKSQTQFGLDLDYKFDVHPFRVAVGYHASSSEKGIATLSLSELRLGARKYQDFDALSIYYGGDLYNVTEAIYVGANVTYTSSTVEFEKFSGVKQKMDLGAFLYRC